MGRGRVDVVSSPCSIAPRVVLIHQTFAYQCSAVPPAQHNDDRAASKWRMFTRKEQMVAGGMARSDSRPAGGGGLSDVYCGLFDSNDRCYFLVLVPVRAPPPSSLYWWPCHPLHVHTRTPLRPHSLPAHTVVSCWRLPDRFVEFVTERIDYHYISRYRKSYRI